VKQLAGKQPKDGIPAVLHGKPEAVVIYNNLIDLMPDPTHTHQVHEPEPDYSNDRAQLALKIDDAMREHAPAGWKGDETKERVVQNFLYLLLSKNRDATSALFEIIKNQPGY
jgi:type I restriction enzyme R subunit